MEATNNNPENIIFSIIVPVYNVQDYLKSSVTSILNQNFKSYEMILVDDGSTDNSTQMCDLFGQGNECIKIIHKKNGGLSDARNAGIKIARGKYVLFLDSDDFMLENCLRDVYSEILISDNPDIIIGTMDLYIENEKIGELRFPEEICVTKSMIVPDFCRDFILSCKNIPWAAYQNVYKKRIIDDYNLRFKKGLVGAEDCEFFFKYLNHVIMYDIKNIVMVGYRTKRKGSIITAPSKNSIIGQIDTLMYVYNKFSKMKYVNKGVILSFFSQRIMLASTYIGILSQDDASEVIKHIDTDLLKSTPGFKYRILNIIWKVFGMNKGSKIICNLRNFKN